MQLICFSKINLFITFRFSNWLQPLKAMLRNANYFYCLNLQVSLGIFLIYTLFFYRNFKPRESEKYAHSIEVIYLFCILVIVFLFSLMQLLIVILSRNAKSCGGECFKHFILIFSYYILNKSKSDIVKERHSYSKVYYLYRKLRDIKYESFIQRLTLKA